MAKPDPALLDPARYPYHVQIPTRFGDLDMNQHINNVAMVGLFEEARARFLYCTGAMGGSSPTEPMSVSFAIEYLRQAFYPAPVDFRIGVSHIGRTSYTLLNLAIQDEVVVASARCVVVTTDQGQPCPMPPGIETETRKWMLHA